MACIKIKLNDGSNREFVLDSLFTDPSSLNNVENFIKDLEHNRQIGNTNPVVKNNLNTLFAALLTLMDPTLDYSKTSMVLPALHSRDVLHAIKHNVEKYGVDMQIVPALNMLNLFGSPVDAGVLDGIIYVDENASISTPIHELAHLVFAVMKMEDFDSYSKFLNIVSAIPQLQGYLKQIEQMPEYANMMELDRIEEAFMRLLEDMIPDHTGLSAIDYDSLLLDINGLPIMLCDAMLEYFQPALIKTFGLKQIPDVMTFFKATMADMPLFGSSLYVLPRIESSGYAENKRHAIKSALVLEYIKQKVENNELEEIKNCL